MSAVNSGKKTRFSLMPIKAIEGMARIMTHAEESGKHSNGEWRDREKEKDIDAIWRHFYAYLTGKVWDDGPDGTGGHHLLCAAVRMCMLAERDIEAEEEER